MSNDICVSAVDMPLTLAGQRVLEHLSTHVPLGARVLDAGCGSVAHYWALGYAHRVRSVMGIDLDPAAVQACQATLTRLDPWWLATNYSDTLTWLQHQHGWPGELLQVANRCAEALAQVMLPVQQHDFTRPLEGLGCFDAVIALESLECVDTREQLLQVCTNLTHVLAPSGVLLAIVTPYQHHTPMVQRFIDNAVEGRLNPDASVIRQVLHSLPLHHIQVQEVTTGIDNYPVSLMIHAQREPDAHG